MDRLVYNPTKADNIRLSVALAAIASCWLLVYLTSTNKPAQLASITQGVEVECGNSSSDKSCNKISLKDTLTITVDNKESRQKTGIFSIKRPVKRKSFNGYLVVIADKYQRQATYIVKKGRCVNYIKPQPKGWVALARGAKNRSNSICSFVAHPKQAGAWGLAVVLSKGKKTNEPIKTSVMVEE